MLYVTSENILVPNQYGFRPGSSTIDSLVDLIDEMSSALDEECFAISLFLDLNKPFDTVNHSILLSKRNLYEIRDVENRLFKSYLNRRRQKLYVNGVMSDSAMINSGAPQGSILGPLLFLIYINVIVKSNKLFFY